MKEFFKNIFNPENLPKYLLIISLCLFSFGYGYLSFSQGWFPHAVITEAINLITDHDPKLPWYYVKTDYQKTIPVYTEGSTYDGLSLVTAIVEDKTLAATVIDMNGDIIHRWNLEWFDLWPDVNHIPKDDHQFPEARPGTFPQGALLLENGDLIFNFTYLGMVKLDVCGNVIWRLPYRTHHSLHLDDNGIIWVPGQIRHEVGIERLPYHNPIFYEFTVLKVSLDGEVLEEISVSDLLIENDLRGLLTLSTLGNRLSYVTGDTLHLNDVETFPSTMEEGVFEEGDVMLSLRNINTVLIFDPETRKVKQISTGTFVRQHDPDFIDGNTISVFDNYNIAPIDYGHQSRIVIMSFADGDHYTYFTGTDQVPFYTDVQGNHQWLPNGNMVITESRKGRAFEIDQQGDLVWEYVNLVGDGKAGIIDYLQRLPAEFDVEYFEQITGDCQAHESE